MTINKTVRNVSPGIERDRGAVLLWFAVMSVALLGMGALVVDAGAMWSERRQLQNGADAAALAVAIDCAAGNCASPQQIAKQYADLNADDGTSDIASICGRPSPLTDCPPPPGAENGLGFVKVQTGTRNSGGGGAADQVNFKLAPVLDENNTGRRVTASAAVVWGTPFGAPIMPFVFSKCAVEPFRQANGTMQFPRVITQMLFHDYTGTLDPNDPNQVCTIMQNGVPVNWPAGFGFTGSASTGCSSEVVNLNSYSGTGTQTGTIQGENNGNSGSSSCATELIRRFNAGEKVLVPVMIWREANGGNAVWTIDGFVSATICAFDLTGSDALELDACQGLAGLAGNTACTTSKVGGKMPRRICGVFEPYTLTDGQIGRGSDYGTRVIKMIG